MFLNENGFVKGVEIRTRQSNGMEIPHYDFFEVPNE